MERGSGVEREGVEGEGIRVTGRGREVSRERDSLERVRRLMVK